MSLILFLLALGITIAVHIRNASAPYTYRHGFISSVVATSARTFARCGILQLGGVPVENNPPIGPNDAYDHWPPLAPAILSVWFRLFGATEMAGHLWMLAIQIVTALLVFAIARAWLGPAGGGLAGFFWLTLPVVVHYGHILLYPSLEILFVLASVLAFLRTRPWLAAVAASLAVCTSWEAVLLAPGLWAAALATKRAADRRMAMRCTIAMAIGLVFFMAFYVWHSPSLFADTIQTAMFRMGLSHAYSQRVLTNSIEPYIGLQETISRIVVNFLRMLGFFGSAAVISLALSRPKGSAVILYGLGLPWLLWCLLMRNHVAGNDIEMIIAAPLSAIGLSWVALGLLGNGINGFKGWAIASLVALAMVIQPWILGTEKSPEIPEQMMGFAAGIRAATGPDAVVLSPLVSTIPVYYSERHIIRCIADEAMMRAVLPEVRKEFPRAPLYWATPLDSRPWVTVTEIR